MNLPKLVKLDIESIRNAFRFRGLVVLPVNLGVLILKLTIFLVKLLGLLPMILGESISFELCVPLVHLTIPMSYVSHHVEDFVFLHRKSKS